MRLYGVKLKLLRQRSSFNLFLRKVSGFHGSIRQKANFWQKPFSKISEGGGGSSFIIKSPENIQRENSKDIPYKV